MTKKEARDLIRGLELIYRGAASGEALSMAIDLFNKAIAEEMPTIEAQPVKHGHWMWVDGVRCSICYYRLKTTGLPSQCSHCGAKMEMTFEKE